MFDDKTLYDFYKRYVVETNKTGWEIITSFEYHLRPIAFEASASIITHLHIAPKRGFQSMDGNLGTNIKKISNCIKHFEEIGWNRGAETGVADIYLSKDENLYAFSVKYGNLMIGNLDIGNINLVNSEAIIGFWVRNKTELLKKAENANKSSASFKDKIRQAYKLDLIFDLNDLNIGLESLRKYSLEKLKESHYQKLPATVLHIHQEMLIDEIKQMFNNVNNVLLHAICRTGKSVIMGGVINSMNISHILIISPIGRSLIQIKEDTFNTKEFDEYEHYIPDSAVDFKIRLTKLKPEEKIIILTTKQMMDEFGKSGINEQLQNLLSGGLMCIDEAHYCSTTDKFKENVLVYKTNNTKLLMMTATPAKTINYFSECEFKKNCISWRRSDIISLKKALLYHNDIIKLRDWTANDTEKLISEFGERIKPYFLNKLKSGWSVEAILSPYVLYPDIMYYTIQHTDYKALNDKIQATQYGLSPTALFKLLPSKYDRQFENKDNISTIIHWIFGQRDSKLADFPNSEHNLYIMHRIEFTNRLKGATIVCPVRIMYLPAVEGQTINETATAFKKILSEMNVLEKYACEIITGDGENAHKDMPLKIKNSRLDAIKNNKKCLLILVCAILDMAITIENCDTCIDFDYSNPDRREQRHGRCQTPQKDKTMCHLINFDLRNTTYNTIYDVISMIPAKYQKGDLKTQLKIARKYCMVDIDTDLFENIETNENDYNKYIDGIESRILSTYKSKMSINGLKEQISQIKFNLTLEEQIELNKIFSEFYADKKAQNSNKEQPMHKVANGCKQSKLEKSKDETDINVNLSEIIVELLPMMTFLIVLNGGEIGLLFLNNLSNLVDTYPEAMSVLNDHIQRLWQISLNQALEVLDPLFKKYLKPLDDADNLSKFIYQLLLKIAMDTSNLSLDNLEGIERFLTDSLKPSKKEQKKYGEVFTPIFLCKKLLDKFPDNIWSDPKTTILEPASGNGIIVFCVYCRLMDGLEAVIPDPEARRLHILTNMIYMIELQKKNTYIIKNLFKSAQNIKYNLNILEGSAINYKKDLVRVDFENKWNINKFTVVVSNPPYTGDIKITGASMICHKFIETYIDRCTYMAYIVSSKCLENGGKGEKLKEFREKFKSRTDIRSYHSYSEKQTDEFFPGTDTKGICIFYKDQSYKGMCDFYNDDIFINKDSFSNFNGIAHMIVTSNPIGKSILTKIKPYTTELPLIKIYKPQSYFDIQPTDENLMSESTPEHDVKCYISKNMNKDRTKRQLNGTVAYISKKILLSNMGIDQQQLLDKKLEKYYVIVPDGNKSSHSGISRVEIVKPGEVYSKTFIGFEVSTELEAQSLYYYFHTRLFNWLLSILKCSQHVSAIHLELIPLPPLNKKWTDESIYNYYKLTTLEQDYINNEKFEYVGPINIPILDKEKVEPVLQIIGQKLIINPPKMKPKLSIQKPKIKIV